MADSKVLASNVARAVSASLEPDASTASRPSSPAPAGGPGTNTVRSGVEPFFRRLFFDCPSVDPEIPSLVYDAGEGRIGGFLGSQPRRMLIDGRPARAGVVGPLVSAPDLRRKGVGALLVRRYFRGPQELTMTDGAGPDVRVLWEKLGAHAVPLGCLTWNRFLRPFQLGADWLYPSHTQRRMNRAIKPVGAALDRMAAAVPTLRLGVDEPSTVTEDLTVEAMLEHLPEIGGKRRVLPGYDHAFLRWLFDEMDAPVNMLVFRRLQGPSERGCLRKKLVRDETGNALGWYIAYIVPGGLAEVLQIAAREQKAAVVIDQLVHDAWSSGASLLRGRLEPPLCEPIWERRAQIRPAARFLVHSRSEKVLDAVLSGDGLLTRLDGDRWIGLHLTAMA